MSEQVTLADEASKPFPTGEQEPRRDSRNTPLGPPMRQILFPVAGYLLCLASRAPALLFPPSGFLYNIDELAMTLQSLDRFLGVPVSGLAWPPTTLSLLSLPVFFADFALHSPIPRTFPQALNLFATYLAHAYADPRHSILLMRWIVAVVSSACPVLAYYVGRRLSDSPGMGLACALLVSFQPTFYQHSVMATGDTTGVTLVLAAVLCLLPQVSFRRAMLAGFLFSAGLAAKITMANLLLLPVLLILLDGSLPSLRKRALALLRFCGSVAVGFMFWCPYVWTDPVRLAKVSIGNVIKPGSQADLRAFLWLVNDALGTTFSVLALLAVACGVCLLFYRRHTRVVLATLAALSATLPPLFFHATTAYPRYFLPALPCLVILLAAGFSLFSFEHTRLPQWRAPVLALVFIAGVMMAWETGAEEFSRRGPDELAAAVGVIRTLPEDTTLFLAEDALGTFQVPLSQRACARMLEIARGQLQDEHGVLAFAQLRGIPADAANVFLWSLNENEQAHYRHWTAACAAASASSRDIFIYYPPYQEREGLVGLNTKRMSVATMDFDGALEAMRRTPGAAILVPFAVNSLGTPLWSGGRWYWYKTQ
jgi:hypothetical protein